MIVRLAVRHIQIYDSKLSTRVPKEGMGPIRSVSLL